MNLMCSHDDFQTVKSVIRRRKTLKVIGDINAPVEITPDGEQQHHPRILEAIAESGWAPFHYDRNMQGIREPWRFYVLWHQDCRKVAQNFETWFDNVKPGNKLPKMLSGCGALVLATWIPQSESGNKNEKAVQVDEEHLSATSAAVQNLLLLLTAQGYGTYWSSGGQFRTPTMFEKLGIPAHEKLIAAVFIEFPETQNQERERIPGKHRDHRAPAEKWTRVVEVQ